MNQKPYSTLFFWTFWALTALIVYLTLFSETDVFQFLLNDPSKITWLISGLFVVSVGLSFILTIFITLETLASYEVERQIKGKGIKGFTHGNEKSSVSQYFTSIKHIVEANGKPDIEVLLTVQLAFYHRVSRAVELAGALLVTLGLIGTVAGLTLTLTGLTSSLEALGHDQELLLSGLRKAMGGMGTAFYTTLLGAVSGGVLLKVFSQITENGIERIYDRLIRLSLVHCSSDFQPSMERDVRFLDSGIELLGQHVKYLESAFSESKTAMSEFRRELGELQALSQAENKSLLESIRRHHQYSDMMRKEVSLADKVNHSLWARIKRFFN